MLTLYDLIRFFQKFRGITLISKLLTNITTFVLISCSLLAEPRKRVEKSCNIENQNIITILTKEIFYFLIGVLKESRFFHLSCFTICFKPIFADKLIDQNEYYPFWVM